MKRALFAIATFVTTALYAQNGEPVRYTLRFAAPQTHYVEVEASYPTRGAKQLEVMMPVWSPGSYLVREYARNVDENVTAATDGGQSVAVEKTRKNRWRFATNGAARMTFRYRVYGREMKVQTNFIDSEFALINGPATFIAPVDQLRSPYEVTVELPKAWSRSLSGLSNIAGNPNRYRAADFDELMDSPIVAGNPAVHEFSVGGKPHVLVDIGGEEMWDAARATADAQKIVEQNAAVWRVVPYEKYLIFNFIVDAGGGLEHRNSTVLMTRRFSMRTRKAYVRWLTLVAHEQFHAWNVKRLRPAALGPFDYENENYTPDLWVSEGFTDYYGNLDVARAGLMTKAEFFDALSRAVEEVQTTPGRLVQPVTLASWDAWIKAYRPDENLANTAIDYYSKGAVIAFLLDMRLRRASDDGWTLDDVMRRAYQLYSGPRGFTDEQFIAVVREIGGAATADWLRRVTSTTAELDYSEALSWAGLEFAPEKKSDESIEAKAWLGATTAVEHNRLIVREVRRDTPAFDSGLNVDDEIVAVDGFRVAPEALDERLAQYRPGDSASLLIARRGRIETLPVKFGTQPANTWKLRVVDKPTPQQQQRLKAWLGRAG